MKMSRVLKPIFHFFVTRSQTDIDYRHGKPPLSEMVDSTLTVTSKGLSIFNSFTAVTIRRINALMRLKRSIIGLASFAAPAPIRLNSNLTLIAYLSVWL